MLPCAGFVEHQVNHVIYPRSIADFVLAQRLILREPLSEVVGFSSYRG